MRQTAKRFEDFRRYLIILDLYVELLFQTRDDCHHRHGIEFRNAAKERCRLTEQVNPAANLQSLLQCSLYSRDYLHFASGGRKWTWRGRSRPMPAFPQS